MSALKQNDKQKQSVNGSDSEYEIGYKKPPKDKQWKKGQSGNPNGRPKKEFALIEHIRKIGSLEGEDRKTILEKVVETVYNEALDGNMQAINFLADRVLGKPQQSIALKEDLDEPIKIIDIDTKK